jgi:hypothetical protein
MEHTPQPTQNTIHSMGVRMTASESNHQRVLALILAEEIQAFQQDWYEVDMNVSAVRRGKPPMSEARAAFDFWHESSHRQRLEARRRIH